MTSVFPNRTDFKLADVTRLRDSDLAMSVMPEKAGYGQYAPTYKDSAFLYEAVLERGPNSSVTIASLIHNGVVTLTSLLNASAVSTGNDLAGAGGAIRRLVTGTDSYRRRLLSWNGMAPDSVDGLIADDLTAPVTDADIRKAMTGGDDGTAFVHEPRLPLPIIPFDGQPFSYPIDAVCDLYWCIMRMDAVMCYPTQSADSSGVSYTDTLTVTTRDYDAQSGQWTEHTDTQTITGTGLRSDSISASREVEQDGDIHESQATIVSAMSGSVRLTYRVYGNGDIVDSAYIVLRARTQGERTSGSAREAVYEQSKFIVVEVGSPSVVSADKALVSWDIPASTYISAANGLRFDLPPLDQSASSASSSASRFLYAEPVCAVVHFAYRTSLAGVSWNYEPDWDANMP